MLAQPCAQAVGGHTPASSVADTRTAVDFKVSSLTDRLESRTVILEPLLHDTVRYPYRRRLLPQRGAKLERRRILIRQGGQQMSILGLQLLPAGDTDFGG